MFALRATRRLLCVGGVVAWALAAGPSALAWAWPADGAVLREFSVADDKYAAGQHRGIDVAVVGGSAIRAPVSGEVTFAGQVPTHGLTVTIVAGEHKASLTHLGPLRVKKGDRVGEGDPIAASGPSGDPEYEVPYVHLGVRAGGDETYIDPLGLLPPRSAPSPPPAPAAPPAPSPQPEPPAPPPGEAAPSASTPPATPPEPTPASPPVPAPARVAVPTPAAVPEPTGTGETSAGASRPTAKTSTQRGAARRPRRSKATRVRVPRLEPAVATRKPAVRLKAKRLVPGPCLARRATNRLLSVPSSKDARRRVQDRPCAT